VAFVVGMKHVAAKVNSDIAECEGNCGSSERR
jgi:hypothetical protein